MALKTGQFGTQGWVKQNYQKAMLFVSFIEVCVLFPRLLLGAVSFQNSVFAPLFFVHFLRLRYYLSPTTRDAFAWVDKQLQAKVIQNQSVPAGVKRGVSTVREMVRSSLAPLCRTIASSY